MTRPAVDLSHRWSFPTPTAQSLPNGARCLMFDLPGQHIAAFDLVLPSPLSLEPETHEGVATVALHAVDEGTTDHPDGRITELLELQGAALHGSAAMGYTTLGGDAPAHRLPEVFRLLAEVLQDPQFADDDVAHHVEAQVAAHESRMATPSAATRQAFRTALFGSAHREGRPAAGVPGTLSAISRADVVAWHAANWTTDRATLVVAGDMSSLRFDQVADAFAGWRRRGTPVAYTPAEPQPASTVIVPMPGSVQATIMVGAVTAGRRHADWPALKLAGHAMAGAFSSRLNDELRERLGYTYGIGGGFSARMADGIFQISGSARTEVAADALARILAALALEQPFRADEIRDAQQHLIGVAPLANETAGDITRQATSLVAANEPVDFVNEHFDALASQTADRASAAFRRHVSPAGLTITVGGDPAVLEPALAGLGLDPIVLG